jgi:hypothetical protein
MNKTHAWRWVDDDYAGPEYSAYAGARQRCTNPKDPEWGHYGGRGIKFQFVCFKQFLAEIGCRPVGTMLDRKNNDGHYEPGNVRWVTPKVSANNRRQSFGKGRHGKANGMFGKKRPDLAEWNRQNLRNKPHAPFSEEHKKNISEAKCRWWATKTAEQRRQITQKGTEASQLGRKNASTS